MLLTCDILAVMKRQPDVHEIVVALVFTTVLIWALIGVAHMLSRHAKVGRAYDNLQSCLALSTDKGQADCWEQYSKDLN